jgi:SynChlorMet cassette radical SAM/SPASM protein ScmF
VNNQLAPPLRMLYFYLTDDCNLACRHCWIAPKFNPVGKSNSSLQIDLFKQAIIEAKSLGLREVKLTGGEPLLHPHFKTLLRIIRLEKLCITIETNGILCTSEVAAEIAKSSTCCVSVSIDGADKLIHESIRGVSGSFEKAKQAVRNLAAAGVRPQVIMTLMRNNFHQMAEVVYLVEKLGASSLKFNIVQPSARAENLFDNGKVLSVPEIIRLSEYVEKDLSSKTNLRLFFDVPFAFRSLADLSSGKHAGVCRILNILGVLANGNYALCGIGFNVPKLVFGKVGIDPLEDVWQNNPILNELRAGLPQWLSGTCSRCLMKFACFGSCIAQNFYRTNSIWSSHWFCEQAEELGMFPKTRQI